MALEIGELGGVICPGCGDEVFRLVEGKCTSCHRKAERLSEADIENRAQLDTLRKELSRHRRKRR